MLAKIIDAILKRSDWFISIASRTLTNEEKIAELERAIQERQNELNSINAAIAEAVHHLNTRLSLVEAQNAPQANSYSAISSPLAIHFFTIVLNGEPFIRYHEQMLAKLPMHWHWHIVEGVADLNHDSAWAARAGGIVPQSLHKDGRSIDGTSEYLDELKKRFPENITIYRKPPGEFWDGKREMCNAPLASITEECLLWEIDSDELWTAAQIGVVHRAFANNPKRTGAFYWAWFFVGPDKVLLTRNNYANNPQQDWLRTWRYRPGDYWASHSPPVLARKDAENSSLQDVARIYPFRHFETEAMGAVFQHFAYATEDQLAFKEIYYGYKDALTQWKELQRHRGRGTLRNYLSWVSDDAAFDSIQNMSVEPIAKRDDTSGMWRFSNS
jgi:hypothetical protein